MQTEEKNVSVVPVVFGAATVLAIMGGVIVAKEAGVIDAGLSKRLVGLAIAFMLVLCGNFVPKLGLFRSVANRNTSRLAMAELMAGRILVLAGIVIMGIWAFAEISRAPLGVALIGLAAIFLALASWLWMKPGTVHKDADTVSLANTAKSRQKMAMQSAILHILHGVAWAFFMLLADEIWGDDSIQWTVLGFVVSMGLITALDMAIKLRRS